MREPLQNPNLKIAERFESLQKLENTILIIVKNSVKEHNQNISNDKSSTKIFQMINHNLEPGWYDSAQCDSKYKIEGEKKYVIFK